MRFGIVANGVLPAPKGNDEDDSTMQRLLFAFVAALMLMASIAGSTVAKQDEPGVPGEPNCFGQTTAFVASNGLKKTTFAGLSSQELKALIEEFCTP